MPDLQFEVDALLADLRLTAPDLPRVISHGNFHAGQLLAGPSGLVVLDLDRLCRAPAAYDVASYVAHSVFGRPGDQEVLEATLDSLVKGYGARPPGLEWYLSTCLLRRAAVPFRFQDEQCRRGLDRAGAPGPGGAPVRPLRDALIPFARPHRGSLARGLVFTCLLVGARLALPLPLTAVLARASSSDSGAAPAAVLSAAFVGLALVAGLAEHQQRLAFAHFAGRTIRLTKLLRGAGTRPAGRRRPLRGPDRAGGRRRPAGKAGSQGRAQPHHGERAAGGRGVRRPGRHRRVARGWRHLAGALLVVVVAVFGAALVGTVAAEHRGHEVALAGSVHRLAEGDRSVHMLTRSRPCATSMRTAESPTSP